jgi:predicted nucleotidyltransferase
MSIKRINNDQAVSGAVTKEEIREIVSILSQYGAEKIYLFGSYATGEAREGSDIDIAVDGMEAGVFFKAFGEILLRMSKDVDLIDLTEAKPTLQNRIEREGRIIYEK